MNVSVAFFDINSDSFWFIYSRRQPPREIAHLIKKLEANTCILMMKIQRLRAGGLKKGMKTDTFNLEKKWKVKVHTQMTFLKSKMISLFCSKMLG